MNKNIFFLMLAMLCAAFSLDAAQQCNSAMSHEEKLEVRRRSFENTLLELIDPEISRDEKEAIAGINQIIDWVAKRDPDDKLNYITPVCVRRCMVKALNTRESVCNLLLTHPFLKKHDLLSAARECIVRCSIKAFIAGQTEMNKRLGQHSFLRQIKAIKLTKALQASCEKKPLCLIKKSIQIRFVGNELNIVSNERIMRSLPVELGDQLVVVNRLDKNNVEIYHYAHQTKKLTKWATV